MNIKLLLMKFLVSQIMRQIDLSIFVESFMLVLSPNDYNPAIDVIL